MIKDQKQKVIYGGIGIINHRLPPLIYNSIFVLFGKSDILVKECKFDNDIENI